MSRITGTDAANLIEAYNTVYAPQEEVELTEEQVQEDFENWVNSLVEEGHDLSEYTWEDMYEDYLNEAPIRYSTGPTAADLQRQRQAQSTKPAPQNLSGLSVGPGGFRINNKPVQPGISPIFQRPGAQAPARPSAPAAAPSRPAATAPARPAAQAPARPAAQPPTSQKPITTPAAPARTPNPLMQRTFGYQTGQAPSQIAATRAATTTAASNLSGTGALAVKPTATATPTTTAPKPNTQQQIRQRRLNMDLDLFDIVQGYLLDEGYAETEEAAAVIMANMSEEWKNQILESGYFPTKESQRTDE